MRNAFFEPSAIIAKSQRRAMLDQLVRRTNLLFALHKPVIISSHRLNYIGGIEENNRKVNLELLRDYFKIILKKHPNIEFMTTLELAEVIGKKI